MLSHAPACGKIPPRARASIKLAGESWTRFLAIWDALAAPDSDYLIEDFGPFYAAFRALQRLGVPFDEAFVRRVEEVALSCRNADDDPDFDGADTLLTDADSGDEDEQCGTPFALATWRNLYPPETPGISRWDPPAGMRYHVVTGKEIGPKPTAGANLIAIARPAVRP